jgi:hypothetical protein
MGDFNDLCEDMRAWQFERSIEASNAAYDAAYPDEPASEPVLIKAAPAPWRQTRAADPYARPFRNIADRLIRNEDAPARGTLETLAKAQPAAPAPRRFDEAAARAGLAKAIADRQCTARQAAYAEGLINRLAAGHRTAATRMTKASGADEDRARAITSALARSGQLTAVEIARLDARRHATGAA